ATGGSAPAAPPRDARDAAPAAAPSAAGTGRELGVSPLARSLGRTARDLHVVCRPARRRGGAGGARHSGEAPGCVGEFDPTTDGSAAAAAVRTVARPPELEPARKGAGSPLSFVWRHHIRPPPRSPLGPDPAAAGGLRTPDSSARVW